MANLKPNKELVVNDILGEMDFGISYNECLLLNSTKWQLADRTFVRYWKEARTRFSELSERTKTAFEEVYLDGKKEALKKAILTKHERMELLTKLAKGEIPTWREVITEDGIQRLEYYSGAEAKAAIAEINKMDGEYAPIRKDITSNGETISIDFSD